MDPASADSSATEISYLPLPGSAESGIDDSGGDGPSKTTASGISSWARALKIPKALSPSPQDDSPTGKSSFARFTSGLGLGGSPKSPVQDDIPEGASVNQQPGFIGSLTKGIVDSSKSAVKAVSVKARHAVSQNKRRFQEDGFDLDMTYITENIIAMGFPAGDMSSGFFGYVEGFYRNHMEEVISYFETRHKDRYKVYNLCSERLYDASLFEGKVACFPFDDHNCPPIQLITLFCRSAYSWLKQDIENVVVVHCKAGMARTGLMICSLLVYLKFYPTAEESMDYYNQRRCIDGKGLVLPSQIRYVKYFERVLTYFNGVIPPARRCMLRGFRLHRCPYWVRPSITVSDHNGVLFSTKKHPRTKDLKPEDYWFTAPKKNVMVFALPGEPGLTELSGDFKIQFHDGQGDFYCWLNTTLTGNRKMLSISDLDGFDKRKLPSPGFQAEVVLADYNGTVPPTPNIEIADRISIDSPSAGPSPPPEPRTVPKPSKDTESNDNDDVFSDSESEEGASRSRSPPAAPAGGETDSTTSSPETIGKSDLITALSHSTKQVSIGKTSQHKHAASDTKPDPAGGAALGAGVPDSESLFKAMAADASVFSFGDEDDYEKDPLRSTSKSSSSSSYPMSVSGIQDQLLEQAEEHSGFHAKIHMLFLNMAAPSSAPEPVQIMICRRNTNSETLLYFSMIGNIHPELNGSCSCTASMAENRARKKRRLQVKKMSFCCSSLSLFCEEEQEHGEFYDSDNNDNDSKISFSPFLAALLKKQDLFGEEEEELSSLFSRETDHEKLFCFSSVSSSSSVMWMLKVSSHHGFAAITAFLAINYLHRFLNSIEPLRPWQVQLAAVACLSLAAKVEETQVPLLSHLQVEDAEYVFEAKAIQRMELLVLSTLQWKMHPVTPISFLDHILRRLGLESSLRRELLRRCERLILSAVADSRFVGYRPSVSAAATMMLLVEQVEPCNSFECRDHLLAALKTSKEMVSSCYELISDRNMNPRKRERFGRIHGSPVGVIDASLSSDDCSNDSWSSSSSSVYSSAETEHALFKRKRTSQEEDECLSSV